MGTVWEMSRTDRDLIFADWGEEIVLRVVTQSYDPETMTAENETEDHDITALVQRLPVQTAAGTGGAFLKRELQVIVRNEDVPSGEVRLTQRILFEEREYEICKTEKSEDGLVTRMECREI